MKRLLSLALATLALAGCGSGDISDDGLSATEKQSASRIDQIAKDSGGDWEKVSQADRDYLVKEISMGSEETAKRMIQGRNGRSLSPGGPPK
ncbi:hypothetical protein EON81_02600 [bacterium]|nr:MAG: hypothetical protein EON81_02600 [bacterium]